MAMRRSLANSEVKEGKSFASVAKVEAVPTSFESETNLDLTPIDTGISRYAARRDYTADYKKMKSERASFKALAEAIAKRHVHIHYVQRESINLIDVEEERVLLKEYNKKRNYEKRHRVEEVKSFSKLCVFKEDAQEGDIIHLLDEIKRFPALPTSVKQIKKKTPLVEFNTMSQLVDEFVPLEEEKDLPIRIKFLLFKLRMTILSFRNAERVQELYSRMIENCHMAIPSIEPQMDTTGVEQGIPQETEHKSNVVIVSDSVAERGVSHQITQGFKHLSVSNQAQVYSSLTDKWLFLGQVDWKSGQGFNTELCKFVGLNANGQAYTKVMEFPKLVLQEFRDSQMAQTLVVNRFFRTDLEFKFILNSSPWQTGMVVCSWVYGQPSFSKGWDNVTAALQRNHVKLSAGSSNDGNLYVPYQHFNSYLSNISDDCTFGYLSIKVLNELLSVDSVSNTASISIFVSFVNSDVHGFIHRNLGVSGVYVTGLQGQMTSIGELCNAGSNVLRTAGKIFNQDKPPLPLQPLSLVPQTVPSFSYTDGIIEPINVLRSDPRGQRVPATSTSEMSLQMLSNGWGYVNTFEWKMSDTTSTQLWSSKICPILDDDVYHNEPVQIGVNTIVYPPVAMLTSMASKCRGNIDFRFEVVSNSYYTGTLQITSIPLSTLTSPTLETMSMSASQVFDISKTTVIDVSVPWNWYNAWMRTPSPFHTGNNIGKIYVVVLNKLISVSTVPQTARINVYMKGGSNYEVCQLRTPLFSAQLKHIKPPTSEYLIPYNTEDAMYTTWNRNIEGSDSKSLITCYIQNVTDGWTGYTNIEQFKVYKLSEKTTKGYSFELLATVSKLDSKTKERKLTSVRVKFGVHHAGLSTSNAKGLVLTDSEATARFIAATFKQSGYGVNSVDLLIQKFPDLQFQQENIWSRIDRGDGKGMVTANNETGDSPIWIRTKSVKRQIEEAIEDLEHHMDTESVEIVTEGMCPTSRYGMDVYGETMPDLKGVARRWQHYSSFSGTTCSARFPRDCPYLFKFPVRPSREIDPISSISYDNRMREGAIALINKMFLFWEGGMRYRFVLSHSVPQDTTMYIQHRFDDENFLTNMEVGSKVVDIRDMMDTHYPTYVQALSVNPTATVEIPYMSSHERLLTTTLTKHPSDNGKVYVWVHSPQPVPVNMEIYYSVADDFQWSVFQGTPSSFDIRDLAPEPQMDTEPQGFLTNLIFGTSQSQVDEVMSKVTVTAETLTKSSDDISKSFNKLSENLQKATDYITNAPAELSELQRARAARGLSGNLFTDLKEVSFDYLTHIVYAAMHPEKTTIAWALVNIYRTAFGFTLDGLSGLSSGIEGLWSRGQQAMQQNPLDGDNPQEHHMEDSDISSMCSVLYCSICSLMQLTMAPPNSWANISTGLFRFSSYARGGAFIGQFIKDNITLFKRVWYKFLSFFGVGGPDYKLLAGISDNRIKNWLLHSEAILNPSVRDRVLTNSQWAEKVFILAVTGRAITMSALSSKIVPPGLMQYIIKTKNELCKLETELKNRRVFCGVRYEPFCLWIAGGAGTGKTRYIQEMSDQLAEMMNVYSTHSYYAMTFGQQYFDGYVAQPNIFIDDFLTAGATQDPSVHLFIQMKTNSLFNPPFSDVKDKCRLVNFYNLFITSNFLEVTSSAGIHDKNAYNRRRDVVISFEPNPPERDSQGKLIEKKDKHGHIVPWTPEEYKHLKHITAYYHPNPLDTSVKSKIEKKSRHYSDDVSTFIKQKAKEYHLRETSAFKERADKKIKNMEYLCGREGTVDDYLSECAKLFSDTPVESGNSDRTLINNILETWQVEKDLSLVDITKAVNKAKEDVMNSLSTTVKNMKGNNECCRKELAEKWKMYHNLVTTQAYTEAISQGKVKSPLMSEAELIRLLTLSVEGKSSNPVLNTSEEQPSSSSQQDPQEQHMGMSEYWPNILYNGDKFKTPAEILYDSEFLEHFEDVQEGHIFEPYSRRKLLQETIKPEFYKECRHRILMNHLDKLQYYMYDKKSKCFFFDSIVSQPDFKELPYSFSMMCYKRQGNKIIQDPDCMCQDTTNYRLFAFKLCSLYIRTNTELSNAWPMDVTSEHFDIIDNFPVDLLKEFNEDRKREMNNIELSTDLKIRMQSIQNHQGTMRQNVEDVGAMTVPKVSRWRTIPQTIWSWIKKISKFVCRAFEVLETVVNYILRFAIVFGTVAVGSTIITEKLRPKPSPHLHPSGDFKTLKQRSSMRTQALRLSTGHHNSQDAEILKFCQDEFVDPSTDGRLKKIISNVFTLVGIKHLDNNMVKHYKVRCIGLRAYEFIVLKHYIEFFKGEGIEDIAIVYRNGKGLQHFKLDKLTFKWGETGGYGVGEFPSLARPFKKITHLIPSERFNQNYPYSMSMVEVHTDEVNIVELECKRINSTKKVPQIGCQSGWDIVDGFAYEWGAPGKCGSFLFCPQLKTPLVGIHTAGTTGRTGYSEMLLQETFTEELIEPDFVEPQMEFNPKGFQLPGEAYEVGHVSADKAVHLPSKTKIVPSEIHEVFDVKTEPAPLSRHDPRIQEDPFDPLYEGIKKRCDKPLDFDPTILQTAVMGYRDVILQVPPVRDPKKLSVKEAIEGFDMEGYEPLEMKTSEGYPWVLDRPKHAKDKSWLFEFTEYDKHGRRELIKINDKLDRTLKLHESMRSRQIIPTNYYSACLKDARISKEKITTPGKTRLFEISPVSLTIAQRQYYLDFYASFQKSRLNSEHTIGINPDGPEWTELAESLSDFSPCILTADYSGYGPRLLQQVQLSFQRLIVEWYELQQKRGDMSEEEIQEEFEQRLITVYELVNPCNIVGDLICYFGSGMPSGNAGTTYTNSGCNSIYIRVKYLELALKYAPHYADMYWFKKFVKMFTNGDDLIMAVKEDIIEWFNNATLIEAFADSNIKMTDALKSGKVRPYCSLEEATYLKRGFMKHPTRQGQWLAPLEENSITDTANWIWQCPDVRGASLQNSEMCCRLAYTRGPQYYDYIVGKIKAAWLKKRVEFSSPSWKSLDMHIWENTEGPRFSF